MLGEIVCDFLLARRELGGLWLVGLGQHDLIGHRGLIKQCHGLLVVRLDAVPRVDQHEYALQLAAALGRLDAVVFTGGVGEKDADVRGAILRHLHVLGVREDPDANAEHGRDRSGRVSSPDSPVVALVVPTDEELIIARDTAELAR